MHYQLFISLRLFFIIMEVHRRTLTLKRASGDFVITNPSEKLTTIGVLGPGLFEWLPLQNILIDPRKFLKRDLLLILFTEKWGFIVRNICLLTLPSWLEISWLVSFHHHNFTTITHHHDLLTQVQIDINIAIICQWYFSHDWSEFFQARNIRKIWIITRMVATWCRPRVDDFIGRYRTFLTFLSPRAFFLLAHTFLLFWWTIFFGF